MIDFEIARKYVEEYGWSVFPVNLTAGEKEGKTEKTPAVPWKKYQEVRPTLTELHDWFDKPRFNGIGLATGKVSGVVVVDLDSKDLPEDIELESEMVAKTISGGRHFYFAWDEELRNDAKIEGLPLDFRGDGGYVVLPPSALGDRSYEWQSECPPFVLTDLPVPIKEILKRRKTEPSLYNAPKSPLESPNGTLVAKVSYDYLSDSFEPAQQGERDVRGTSVAGTIIKELRPDQWLKFGWTKFTEWNDTNKPPMGFDQLRKIWKSVCDTELRNHPEVIKGEEIGKLPTPMGLQQVIDANLADKELSKDCPKTGLPTLDHMVRGFVPKHTYTLTGDTNVGKTSVACFFAVKVAKQGKKVLYMALEPDTGIVEYLASIIKDKPFEELNPQTDYDFGDLPIKIYTKQHIRKLEQLIEVLKAEERYDLIIIDHIGYFVSNTANPNQEQANVMKRLTEISTTRQTAVLAIVHLNKNAKKGKIPSMNDMSGSKAFSQDSTDVWILHKELDSSDKTKTMYTNTGYLIVAKSKNSASGPVEINFGVRRAGISEVNHTPVIYQRQEPEEREVVVPKEEDATVQLVIDTFK